MAVRNSPLNAYRPENEQVPYVKIARQPTSSDYKNPQTNKYFTPPFHWVIGKNPSTGTEGDLYYLADVTANVADWKLMSTGSTPGGNLLTLTGDDSEAVSADTGGNMDVQGVAVANATNAKPLYIDGTPASSLLEAELQVAAAITGAPGDKNDAGICSFDDTAFSVDADGYVTANGGSLPLTFATDSGNATPAASIITFAGGNGVSTSGSSSTVTIDLDASIVDNWVEVTGTSQSASVGTGYILNNASLVTLTLPSTASIGDRVRAVGKGAGFYKLAQNAGQTVHVVASSTTTGAGGSLTATERYASLELVCITANSAWVVMSMTGNFTIV